MNTLYKHFEILEDLRDIRGKKHELINVLIKSIYGIYPRTIRITRHTRKNYNN